MSTVAKSNEQWLAESRAHLEWAERVARDDPDWTYYPPGQPRKALPWWRRLLKL